jgi:hypothetical protein
VSNMEWLLGMSTSHHPPASLLQGRRTPLTRSLVYVAAVARALFVSEVILQSCLCPAFQSHRWQSVEQYNEVTWR